MSYPVVASFLRLAEPSVVYSGERMVIRKYRSVEEMPGPQTLPRLHPDNLRRACELSETAYRLCPWHLPPGVKRFRTLDEAYQRRRSLERLQAAEKREPAYLDDTMNPR